MNIVPADVFPGGTHFASEGFRKSAETLFYAYYYCCNMEQANCVKTTVQNIFPASAVVKDIKTYKRRSSSCVIHYSHVEDYMPAYGCSLLLPGTYICRHIHDLCRCVCVMVMIA